MTKMKTIGVFTSGGDSPGMNACIRAIVRTAVKALIAGKHNIMFGKMKGEISEPPFEQAIKQHNPMNPNLLELVKVLSI